MRSFKNIVFLGILGLAVAACGGGGGDTLVSSTPTPQPTSQSEYDKQTNAARAQFEKRLSDALVEADTFMDNNRRENGVITTTSGLQYRVDKVSPNPTGKNYEGDQDVTVDYEGSLADGTVFDSTFERGRPESFKPSELIDGWQEALNLMQPGDEWTLFIPPALGYGEIGKTGSIPANAVLVFKIELR